MQIGLIGAGNMARGLARGWGQPVICTDVIADRVFMLTPRNVEISAEERAQLIEKGFFNQS